MLILRKPGHARLMCDQLETVVRCLMAGKLLPPSPDGIPSERHARSGQLDLHFAKSVSPEVADFEKLFPYGSLGLRTG